MRYQKGVFSIELSFVLLGMCVFLFFIFDLGFQVVQKSQLHRASYSLASVLKERKDPFEWSNDKKKADISLGEAIKIHRMAEILLDSDNDDLRVNIGFKSGAQDEQIFRAGNSDIQCDAQRITDDMTDGSHRDLNVYRVTICRRVPAFFEKAISGQANKDSRVLQSTSLFVGR
ncbi:tight adherence pilus pseudopilin TadF [Vibrio europaeus]|uniref:tight adherence pilus pseudopilin TadF n=1 Tax=Vibrio europaeus TaxID=300876 RepID=UPI00233F0F15|nr:tight adherence pilus pseudopilin TadF [Vibrio europaeus]MDC5805647.1 tight adherence pilus pseudopilin TadF [Vibrio europaeus]MDC5826279.1 tight adherence pilus pseudopilin TadF [Vibrio europaeus]MDC5831644.1 tight adherence pilus pseudopilin TadF [Vibrio europaeus]MDC5834599.1 tight adherence pilus pseudopilin TadF [Vibrio europaeus]